MRKFERDLLQCAIDEASGDRKLAAQRLGIGLSSLYRKIDESQAGEADGVDAVRQ
jgi:DNA-binding NtrC family response regulator